jgi:outer membrane protein assembly factor BamD (BamD/ComL family)
MSVSGISSSSLSTYGTSGSSQNNFQQIQQVFQQLGQDLQSGNLSAAQSDFVTLTKLVPKLAADVSSSPTASTSSSQSSNPLLQDFQQLSKDLQSGNLSAAQSDYTNIQQAFQHFSPTSGGTEGTGGHHHHHGGNGDVGNGLLTASDSTTTSSSSGSSSSGSAVSVSV